jgi:hypothetical protein
MRLGGFGRPPRGANHEASFAFTQNREIHLRPSNRRLIGIDYLALVSNSWRQSDGNIERACHEFRIIEQKKNSEGYQRE